MKKTVRAGLVPASSIEEQLKVAGFKTIKAVGEKHIHASGADNFDKSHAAFLQGAGKVSAFRMEACPQPILIVFRPEVESDPSAASDTAAPVNPEPEPASSEFPITNNE